MRTPASEVAGPSTATSQRVAPVPFLYPCGCGVNVECPVYPAIEQHRSRGLAVVIEAAGRCRTIESMALTIEGHKQLVARLDPVGEQVVREFEPRCLEAVVGRSGPAFLTLKAVLGEWRRECTSSRGSCSPR